MTAKRERNIRKRYVGAPSPSNAIEDMPDMRYTSASDLPAGVGELVDRSATWASLAQLAGTTALPVVVKGILTGEDARLAVESGARAIVVSNHGGRQLDTAVTSLEALPEVAAAANGSAEVY